MKNRISLDDNGYASSEQAQVVIQDKGAKKLWKFIGALCAVMGVLAIVFPIINGSSNKPSSSSGPHYYIAQIPSEVGNASFNWTGVIDGYMHKDKECCQSVVDYWNSTDTYGSDLEAELVEIDRYATAYKNYKGQSVSYDSALGYCSLCWNRH